MKTAWKLLNIDLVTKFTSVDFRGCQQLLYGRGSLQVIQVKK
jgi:hypothetical protein